MGLFCEGKKILMFLYVGVVCALYYTKKGQGSSQHCNKWGEVGSCVHVNAFRAFL